jgi:hypothetical protein
MKLIYRTYFTLGREGKYSVSPYPNTDNLLAIVFLAEVGGIPGHPGFEPHSFLPVQVQVSSKILLRKATV